MRRSIGVPLAASVTDTLGVGLALLLGWATRGAASPYPFERYETGSNDDVNSL